MTSATNSFTPADNAGVASKIAGAAYAVASTLFGISLREKLDAETKADKADAEYTWGM
ncbi:hypothetical protein ACIPF8_24405 [Collimonas sp. NPDC087041]|uniref:hypothetical protein n=1 Tax=Collimonas sp. NPDC087041 TaxID=3363960 RepID=UPI0037F232B3